jgi:hypothetical protein
VGGFAVVVVVEIHSRTAVAIVVVVVVVDWGNYQTIAFVQIQIQILIR